MKLVCFRYFCFAPSGGDSRSDGDEGDGDDGAEGGAEGLIESDEEPWEGQVEGEAGAMRYQTGGGR